MSQQPALTDEDLLVGLEGLAGEPEDLGLDDDLVTCRVCQSQIDATTGEPVSPVTQANVEAVQTYETMASQAQRGGQVLDLESVPGGPAGGPAGDPFGGPLPDVPL